jgi:hypothetical protein
VGASNVLAKLQTFGSGTIESLIAMNDINLSRLTRRSVLNWGNRVLVGTGSILGVWTALDKVLSIDISNVIPDRVIDYLLYALVGGMVGGVINMIILMPRIALVRALGDILTIAKSYQPEKSTSLSPRAASGHEPLSHTTSST